MSYYSTDGFHSAGGPVAGPAVSRLAERHRGARRRPVAGMRLPVLRETRMTAVVCSLGPVAARHRRRRGGRDAIVAALGAWALSPMLMT